MSMANIPNITPNINVNREQVINVILASIALEELGLAHILNAEGEKIQETIAHHPSIDDLICIDNTVNKMLRDIIKKEILLQFKLEDVISLIKDDKNCKKSNSYSD